MKEPEDRSEIEDETPTPPPDKAPLDMKSLEEPPSGDGDPRGNIVTIPLGADQRHSEDDPDTNKRRSAKGQEARLREELHALAEELQRKKRDRNERGGEEDDMQESRELWGRLRGVTGALAQQLCEQLRLVLEPMVATKLQGDYRSGKRINMRRVIPYIASGFRKDKIWLRRTKPAKRDYQVRDFSFFGFLAFWLVEDFKILHGVCLKQRLSVRLVMHSFSYSPPRTRIHVCHGLHLFVVVN